MFRVTLDAVEVLIHISAWAFHVLILYSMHTVSPSLL